MRKWLAGIALVLAFAGTVWQMTQPSPVNSAQTTRFPSARVQKDGDNWLGWDESERKGFIRGYLSGYKSGHNQGCGEAIAFLVPDGTISHGPDPKAQCENSQFFFPHNADHYVQLITSFYQMYPTDREIPLPMMMWLLSDQQNKTPAQIHEWYVSGGNRGVPSTNK
jgi:hypothetical protein